jgi:deoxyribodipyrimidine photo-lyase
MHKSKQSIYWFRRDLRFEDNVGLAHALQSNDSVQPIFIFDQEILSRLKSPQDRRVQFIHQTIQNMKAQLQDQGRDLLVFHGKPLEIFQKLHKDHGIQNISTNHDYEPYPRRRDQEVLNWANSENIEFKTFKDQVIFEKKEVLTDAAKPYTVYTPYKRKWLSQLNESSFKSAGSEKLLDKIVKSAKPQEMITLKSMGFEATEFSYPGSSPDSETLKNYATQRNFPANEQGTSRLGLHLRFGTVSIRKMAKIAQSKSDIWLSELIWREFFMQILWNFPDVVKSSFRPAFEKVAWRENEEDFKKWCEGKTGYPLVDAGMRELNQTGHMHNRVRMVTASFLTKHLLMHWLKGERYFAGLLLDYELSANNGNWQWAAGTGCDAAPYFRIFNPETQLEKFDPDLKYVKKWVPEYGTKNYPPPMIDHKVARDRCLKAFDLALKGKEST